MSYHTYFPGLKPGEFYELIVIKTRENAFTAPEEYTSMLLEATKDDEQASQFLFGRFKLKKGLRYDQRLQLADHGTLLMLNTFFTEDDLTYMHTQPSFQAFKNVLEREGYEVEHQRFAIAE